MEGLKDAAKAAWERIADPFVFATFASWAMLHWRFFVVLWHAGARNESHEDLLRVASAQLGFDWTEHHTLNLWIPVLISIGIGLLYALGYPYLGARIRVWRDAIKANAERDLAAYRRKLARESRKAESRVELLSRDQWLKGSEMQRAAAVEKELLESLRQAYSDLAPRFEPHSSGPSCFPTPFGPVAGFAIWNDDGKIVPLPHPPYRAEKLAYVFKNLPDTGYCLAVKFGSPFPLPKDGVPDGRIQYLTSTKILCAETTPDGCIAHVKRLNDGPWGILLSGAPTS